LKQVKAELVSMTGTAKESDEIIKGLKTQLEAKVATIHSLEEELEKARTIIRNVVVERNDLQKQLNQK